MIFGAVRRSPGIIQRDVFLPPLSSFLPSFPRHAALAPSFRARSEEVVGLRLEIVLRFLRAGLLLYGVRDFDAVREFYRLVFDSEVDAPDDLVLVVLHLVLLPVERELDPLSESLLALKYD